MLCRPPSPPSGTRLQDDKRDSPGDVLIPLARRLDEGRIWSASGLQREGPARLTRNGRGHDTRSLDPSCASRDHQCEGGDGDGDETRPEHERDSNRSGAGTYTSSLRVRTASTTTAATASGVADSGAGLRPSVIRVWTKPGRTTGVGEAGGRGASPRLPGSTGGSRPQPDDRQRGQQRTAHLTRQVLVRRRPAAADLPAHEALVHKPRSPSFPSAHAAVAAAFTTALARRIGPAGVGVAPVAGAVAYSRVRTRAHWPTDVAVGVVEGVLVGEAVHRAMTRHRP